MCCRIHRRAGSDPLGTCGLSHAGQRAGASAVSLEGRPRSTLSKHLLVRTRPGATSGPPQDTFKAPPSGTHDVTFFANRKCADVTKSSWRRVGPNAR